MLNAIEIYPQAFEDIDHLDENTQLGKSLKQLRVDWVKAREVLDFQKQQALIWCQNSGFDNETDHSEANSKRPMSIEQIRTTVDYIINNGFAQCEMNFIHSWQTIAMHVPNIDSDQIDSLNNRLQLCLKAVKVTTLDTLDQLKMECFMGQ